MTDELLAVQRLLAAPTLPTGQLDPRADSDPDSTATKSDTDPHLNAAQECATTPDRNTEPDNDARQGRQTEPELRDDADRPAQAQPAADQDSNGPAPVHDAAPGTDAESGSDAEPVRDAENASHDPRISWAGQWADHVDAVQLHLHHLVRQGLLPDSVLRPPCRTTCHEPCGYCSSRNWDGGLSLLHQDITDQAAAEEAEKQAPPPGPYDGPPPF